MRLRSLALAGLALLALTASQVVHSAPEDAPADGTEWSPGTIWPKPAEMSSDCAGGDSLSLRGARLAGVDVQAGDRQAGEAYVRRAWELAQQHDWPNCTAGDDDAAAGPSVYVTVQEADCVDPACFTAASDESYELRLSADGNISIAARSIFGVNPALASLASLAAPAGVEGAEECEVGCLPIELRDRPRFGHRGVMLDTARNFFSPDDIKRRLLDPMHLTKLNVMHWHVYDSQSQPLEVKGTPGLWQPYSAAQNYTQAQARELIDYAFARGIRVLPEFDMPGHTAIFAKAFPDLVACLNYVPWDGKDPEQGGMCNQPPCGQLKPEEGADLAVALVKEWVQLFPNSIVSTGADEVNFNCWNEGVVPSSSAGYPEFQKKSLKKLAGFQEKVAAAVNGAGRTWGVWEESFSNWGFAGTPALPNGSVLFTWLGSENINNATRAGYDVIATPYQSWYLDCGLGTPGSDNWCNPLKSWTTMYEFDPTASVDPAAGGDPRRVLGGQAAMWSEHLRPVLLDYAVWPRAAAMAERLWSPAEDTKSAKAAQPRLEQLMRQLEARGLRPSPLNYQGLNWRYDLLPQWCDTVTKPQVNHEGVDYCAPAKTYARVNLSDFDALVLPSKA